MIKRMIAYPRGDLIKGSFGSGLRSGVMTGKVESQRRNRITVGPISDDFSKITFNLKWLSIYTGSVDVVQDKIS